MEKLQKKMGARDSNPARELVTLSLAFISNSVLLLLLSTSLYVYRSF